MIRVAINGFGRVGRAFARLASVAPDLEIVAINDPAPGDNLAYLLKYDSVHGRFNQDVRAIPGGLLINEKRIRVYGRRMPLPLPWRKHKPEVVIEATGRFTSPFWARSHRLAGAKRVLITAIPSGAEAHRVPMYVVGLNDRQYSGEPVISGSSCTVNCAGPVIKVLHEAFGLEKGVMTCVHAYTRDQELLDGVHHREWRRGRAAGVNIVPGRSGAAKALSAMIPGLKGRLESSTIRVPVPDGSLLNIVCTFRSAVTEEEVNKVIRDKAEDELKGVVGCASAPLVSADLTNDLHSAVFDPSLTCVLKDNLVRVACWFDHEYGYAARLLDLVRLTCSSGAGGRSPR